MGSVLSMAGGARTAMAWHRKVSIVSRWDLNTPGTTYRTLEMSYQDMQRTAGDRTTHHPVLSMAVDPFYFILVFFGGGLAWRPSCVLGINATIGQLGLPHFPSFYRVRELAIVKKKELPAGVHTAQHVRTWWP